jgi:hypothetical protein
MSESDSDFESPDVPSRVKRVENNTGRFIVLPPTESFIGGVRLPPESLTTVPQLYFDELYEAKRVVKKTTAKGKDRIFSPGEELIKQLQEPVKIVTVDKTTRGPQITIYEPEQVADREDGPSLPDDLELYTDEVAIKLIQNIRNKAKLKLYANDRRPAVKAAALAQLG